MFNYHSWKTFSSSKKEASQKKSPKTRFLVSLFLLFMSLHNFKVAFGLGFFIWFEKIIWNLDLNWISNDNYMKCNWYHSQYNTALIERRWIWSKSILIISKQPKKDLKCLISKDLIQTLSESPTKHQLFEFTIPLLIAILFHLNAFSETDWPWWTMLSLI